MTLPTWEEASAANSAGNATPLENFIFCNEPSPKDEEKQFREMLLDMLTDADKTSQKKLAGLENNLRNLRAFYEQRMSALQDYQKTLPDPIRQDVCDILANGYLGTRSCRLTTRSPCRACDGEKQDTVPLARLRCDGC